MANAEKVTWLTFSLCVVLVAMIFASLLAVWKQHRANARRVERLAYRDELTGLMNRNYLLERGAKLLASQSGLAVYGAFDVDNFKLFNQNHSYEQGDRVLQLIGRVLRQDWKAEERAFRLSNDNFSVIFGSSSQDEAEKQLQELHELIQKALAEEGPGGSALRFSFGVCIARPGMGIAKVVDCADMARKAAKNSQAEFRAVFFDEKMLQEMQQRKVMEDSMAGALERGEFVPYLQPKVEIATGKVVGAEVLVRWIGADGVIKQPDSFIPLMEANGFIRKVDIRMFEEACRIKHRWQKSGFGDIKLSVNLSRSHISGSGLVELLCGIADRMGVPRQGLELEVTESFYVENANLLIGEAQSLKAAGFSLSMDDFGSGYSSLNLLKDIPIDVLKLDKAFLSEAQTSLQGRNIIRSIVWMAQSIGVEVICEGVETREQADFLFSVGCFTAQGYLYSKPLPLKDFEAFCAREARRPE